MTTHAIKAAVCREFGAPLAIEELRLAAPAPRQVRIKVAACAVCHSDLTYMDGGWGGALPAVFGHEVAGVVAEAGGQTSFRPGMRVIAALLRSCGRCAACESGAPFKCIGEFDDAPHLFDKDGAPVLAGLKTGGFAEQVLVDESQVAAIPDDMPFEEAALISCGVLTGWGAVVNTARVPAGASVAVVGCGGVGLNCLQGAANSGAAVVVAVDTAKEKLAIAGRFGATYAAASGDEAMRHSGGRGFDYVFMAAGSARAAEAAAALVAERGALVLAGMPPSGELASLDILRIAHGAQRVLGSKMGGARLRVDVPRIINLHKAGKFKLAELVGEQFPLSRINDAIAAARRADTLRCIVRFDS